MENLLSDDTHGGQVTEYLRDDLSDEHRFDFEAEPLPPPPVDLAPVVAASAPELGVSEAPATSRKVRKQRRERARSKTIAPKRLTKEEIRIGQLLLMPDVERPLSRADCKDMPRPCPFVSCKHHLYLDVNPETGSIKLNFPDLEVWEMKETCSLDVADRGGITLEEVGEILNLTRERIRQVEVRGLLKLKMEGEVDGSRDLVELEKNDELSSLR
jgi:hypothetical protein